MRRVKTVALMILLPIVLGACDREPKQNPGAKPAAAQPPQPTPPTAPPPPPPPDEAPIKVRNGSMEIDTPNGTWKEGYDGRGNKDHWIEETQNGDPGRQILHVLVLYKTTTGKSCFGSDRQVRVRHSDLFEALLDRTNDKTRVRPHNKFTKKTDQSLRYEGTVKDSYIKEVQVGNTTCPIGQHELEVVCISGKLPMACSK